MRIAERRAATALAVLLLAAAAPVAAQHPHHEHHHEPDEHDDHDHHAMWTTMLPGGWHLMGMANVVPAVTFAAPFADDSPLSRTELSFPHAAIMAQVESPGGAFVFRLMPNFEGLTLPDGEPTFGGWGEGFIDARHPHTLLHEAMLSLNWWDAPGGAASLSAGRGFVPFGTDDPMYRPALKYPTNHHLSQILERWTLTLAYIADAGFGIELALFDGDEPEDPWDMGNYRNFGNSWAGRASLRFGPDAGGARAWEATGSYGRVRETHGGQHEDLTVLYNAALRHEAHHPFGQLYALAEASRSEPDDDDGFFSVLAEAQLGLGEAGRHRPFYRIELATRPEYPREAATGDGFFRYDHGDHPIGATRWLINTAGYGYDVTDLPFSVRPFIEIGHHRIRHERGPASLEPETLFGGSSFWSIAAGARLFLGGGPMRMGRYGVADPMTRVMRATRM